MSQPAGPATLRASVRALPRAAWVLYAGTFVNRFGSFVLVFLVLMLVSRGYTPVQAGAAASLYGVGALLAAFCGGHLADHLGRRRTIALSMFSSAATLLALSQARALPLVMALTLLAGATGELYRPAASALLADVTPPGGRVAAFALYRVAVNAGFAVGPAVAGLLADHSFTLLFVGDALTSALYGVLALVALPETRPAPHAAADADAGAPARPPERASMLRVLRGDPALLTLLAGATALAFVYMQSQSTLALQVRAHGLTPAHYGLLASLNGAVVLALELPLATYTSRLPAWRSMAAGALLFGVGFGATGVADTLPLLAFTVLLWSLGEIAFFPVASAYVADLAPPHMRGRYQAALGMTSSIGLVLAPGLGAALFARSPGGLWALCLGLGTAAACGLLAVGRLRPAAREARVEAAVVAGD